MALSTVIAIHTFVAEHGDELEFTAGEKIEIIERDDAFGDGWWKGRNAKGEEGLFPATYITEDPDYVVPTPPAAAAAGLPADGADPKSTPSPDTAATDPAGKSPIPVPASPNNNQTSTPPLATSDKLAASGNLASPFSAAAGDNRNSLLDVTGAPRGASGTAGAVGAGAAVGAGVGAAGVAGSNVMGSTIGQVQDAIDTMGKGSPAMDSNGPTVPQGVQLRDPQEASKAASGVIRRGIDDDEDDDDEADPEAVGIAHDARARLAEQAKLANEERDRQAQRESGGIADLIYSDESEDEDDASSHRNSNTYPRTHRNGSVTTPTIDEESDLHATREEGTFAKQQNLPSKQEDEISSAATPVSTTYLATAAPVLSTSVAETQVNGGPEAKTPTAVVDDHKDEATPQQRSASPATESNKGVLAGAAAAIGAGTAAIGAALLSSSDSQTTIHAKDAPQADKAAVQSDLQKTQTPEIAHSHSPSLKQSETLPQSQSPSIQQTSSDLQPSPRAQQSERLAEDPKQASPRPDAAQLQPALPIAAAAAASSQTPPVQQTPPPQHSSTMSTPAGLPSAATPSSTVNLASPPPPTPDNSRIPAKPPATWTVEDVVQWSRARGFDEAVSAKFVEHDISGDVLLELDANLLKELDIPQLGKRLRIASAINDLRRPVSNPSSSHSQQQQHHAYPTPTSIQQSPAYADQHLPTSSAGSAHSGSLPPSAFVGGAALAAAAGAGAAGIAASQSTTTPGGSPNVDDHHSAWAHGRKVSVTPTTSSIDEAKAIDTKPKVFGTPANNNTSSSASSTANGTINGHTATRSVSSVPTTPGTPAIGGIGKRESTGSLGHKKKGSVDKSDRLSFFGRGRKPPPVGSPGTTEQRSSSSRLGFGSGSKPAMNTMHADRPEKRVSSGPSAAVGGALRTIGTPDKQGYLKKRGGGYNAWKTRFFVLKGSHLYFLKSESEDHVKGRIDLKGHRIIVDESSNGSYGFRLVGPGVEKPHFFSSSDQREIRDWMKALMKATIQRDYTVPVTSSCNIPTIPLSEAQALQPRPPSPGERDATQRANRRENVNQLTPRDASVLMSLDTSGSGRRMTSHGSSLTVQPSRPSRDTRRPSGDMRRPSTSTRPSVQSYYQTEPTPEQTELLNWVNQVLPSQYPRVANFPNSFISGEVIFLLVKHISGLELDPPVPSSAFAPDSKGMPNDEGLLAMGQMVIEAGVDNGSRLHLPDVRAGDAARITELLEIVRAWAKERV